VLEPTERLELLAPGKALRAGDRDVVVEARRGTRDRPIVKLRGVEDRPGAEELRGLDLTVEREDVGDLDHDEFFAADLVSLEVRVEGRAIGHVREVLFLPSAEVLEVEREGDAPLLVPFLKDAVSTIDLELGRIEVRSTFLNLDRPAVEEE
jgi:16S rRNA processing protein RimM